jgi:hypothetical protein
MSKVQVLYSSSKEKNVILLEVYMCTLIQDFQKSRCLREGIWRYSRRCNVIYLMLVSVENGLLPVNSEVK